MVRIIWQLVRIELWGHYEKRRLDKGDAILAILAFPLLIRVFTHTLGIQNVWGVIELVLLLFLVLKSFESCGVIRNDVDVVWGVQKPNRKIWEVFFCNQSINVSHYSTPASAATRKYNLSGIVKFMLAFKLTDHCSDQRLAAKMVIPGITRSSRISHVAVGRAVPQRGFISAEKWRVALIIIHKTLKFHCRVEILTWH